MSIGDKITCPTQAGKHTGTVVYIHPEGRYFTARFTFRHKWLFGLMQTHSFCESFLMRRRGA